MSKAATRLHQQKAPGQPRPPTLTSRTSIVVAVGPDDEGDLAGLQWALEVSDAFPDIDIVVVEEREPGRPRLPLQPSLPRGRVVHRIYPYGSIAAYATGVNATSSDFLVMVAPHATAGAELITELLTPFDLGPEIGWVAAENQLGGASGIVAVRRGAIESIGGAQVLLGPGAASGELGPLPWAMFVELARGGLGH